MLESPAVDAVAIKRWTHGPLVLQGLEAGKHVYSAVPMAITAEETAAIIDAVRAVRATGLTYMMGETSQYNLPTVHARIQIAEGAFPYPPHQHIAPELRAAFTSGSAPVHDPSRLPREFDDLHNGHEGSHHFLVDDFVTAVNTRTLPSVNAWVTARYTLPGIVAHESARHGGVRLEIPDLGGAPEA